MNDDPTPNALLEAVLGKRLASRMTLWHGPEPKPRGVRILRDAMIAADRKAVRRAAFRQYGMAALLTALGGWTAISLAFNQTVLASLGPTGVLGVLVVYLTLHERVRVRTSP